MPAVDPNDPLYQDFLYFLSFKPSLLPKHEGRYALVKDRQFVGIFDTGEEATQEGWRRFGYVPIMVGLIQKAGVEVLNADLKGGLILVASTARVVHEPVS